jgi:hypothetical protein
VTKPIWEWYCLYNGRTPLFNKPSGVASIFYPSQTISKTCPSTGLVTAVSLCAGTHCTRVLLAKWWGAASAKNLLMHLACCAQRNTLMTIPHKRRQVTEHDITAYTCTHNSTACAQQQQMAAVGRASKHGSAAELELKHLHTMLLNCHAAAAADSCSSRARLSYIPLT